MPVPTPNSSLASPSHSALHAQTFEVWENVMYHGAVGDGSTDDTAAIQAAVDAIGTTGGTLFFPPGTYKVSSPGIVLPGETVGVSYRFRVVGYGAEITATTAISMMTRANPTSYSPSAVQMTNGRFRIEGLKFSGNGTSAQVGLDMVATYGMEIVDCEAISCDVGFRLTYCLMARVSSCFTESCVSYGFVARSGAGVFTGGTVDNSGSNHTVFERCRSYASSGQDAEFYIRASSNVVLRECITEGLNPDVSVDWQSGAASVKSFLVSNLHCENSPASSVLKIVGDVGGTQIVDQLWVQNTNLTLIDSTGGVSNTILVRDIPWAPTGTKFKAGAEMWMFEGGVGQVHGSDFNPNDTAAWVGGTLPSYMEVRQRGVYNSNPASVITPVNNAYIVGGGMVIDGGVRLGTGGLSTAAQTSGNHYFLNNNHYFYYQNEANPRWLNSLDSGMWWGAGGASAVDTNLYRSAADTLKTDDKLIVAGELEVDGALNHDGTTVGFYGVAPTTRQVLATGAGATVDQVITALQTLGLLSQT